MQRPCIEKVREKKLWTAGLLYATQFVMLSAEEGNSAVHVPPFALEDNSRRLVMMPPSFSVHVVVGSVIKLKTLLTMMNLLMVMTMV